MATLLAQLENIHLNTSYRTLRLRAISCTAKSPLESHVCTLFVSRGTTKKSMFCALRDVQKSEQFDQPKTGAVASHRSDKLADAVSQTAKSQTKHVEKRTAILHKKTIGVHVKSAQHSRTLKMDKLTRVECARGWTQQFAET